ncbi:MAG: SCO family protein [Candidatus Tectomicrobia bacterium]|nr:SCO family protein [Candidatus Tectomicrobia bacterium]
MSHQERSEALPTPRQTPDGQRSWQEKVLLPLVVLILVLLLGVGAWRMFSKAATLRAAQLARDTSLPAYGRVPPFMLLERTGQPLDLADLIGKVWIADFIYTRCELECPLASARLAQLQDRFHEEADLRLVSFSVDPEYDTPAVLLAYARRFHADPQRWLFLTGEKEAIRTLIRDGFKLSLGERDDDRAGGERTSVNGAVRPGFSAARRGAEGTSRMAAQPRVGRGWERAWRKLGEVRSALSPAVAWAHEGHGPSIKHTAPTAQVTHSSRFVLVDRQARIRGYYHSNDPDALRRLIDDAERLLRQR